MIFPALGAFVDLLHALIMVAWVLGLPLLFWHRYPQASRAYAVFAVAFVIINKLSEWTLGECFLTTIARALWQSTPAGATPARVDQWFTVRLAHAVFGLTPSREAVKLAGEVVIFFNAIGVVFLMRRHRAARDASRPQDVQAAAHAPR